MRPEGRSLLLTGGTGYLGSRLLRELLAQGWRVLLLKRSTSSLHRIADLLQRIETLDVDRQSLEEAFSADPPQVVLHTATDYGRGGSAPSAIVEANLAFPLRLLELAVQYECTAFISTDTTLPAQVNPYALSKRQFGEWMEQLAGPMRCINLRLEHFYGAGDDETKFVTWLIAGLLRHVPRIPLTEGLQRRDFVHVDDVLDACIAVLSNLERLPAGQVRLEIGSGRSIAVRDFALLAARLVGNAACELDFGAIPLRHGEAMESKADLTAMAQLGWTPRITLEDGLRHLIDADRGRFAS